MSNPMTTAERAARKKLDILAANNQRMIYLQERIVEMTKRHLEALQTELRDLSEECKELRDDVTTIMADSQIQSVFSDEYKATLRDIKPTLEVVDELLVPKAYKEIKYVINKRDLNAAFKKTGDVPAGCKLNQGAWTVAIEFSAKK